MFQEVLDWITAESSGDHTIEIVTDNMLDQVIHRCQHPSKITNKISTSQQNINITNKSHLMQIVAENDHVAVMFYEKGDERSEK